MSQRFSYVRYDESAVFKQNKFKIAFEALEEFAEAEYRLDAIRQLL